jgi:hypothetical protein
MPSTTFTGQPCGWTLPCGRPPPTVVLRLPPVGASVPYHEGRGHDPARDMEVERAAHPIVGSLAPYPTGERAALLPHVVRVMLAAFLEAAAEAGEIQPKERGS